ncbi:MAG: hypothetical protein JJT82_08605 [Legionellaceae bacterium]|nr:hypothetical protein [Legionellaceae bacterium]
MQSNKRKMLIMLTLAVLFLLPGMLAGWLFYHPEWLNVMRTNKGQLLSPPYRLSTAVGNGKWQLYYWHPAPCESLCQQELDQLARVRLALGRRLYQVDLQWLLSEHTPAPAAELVAKLAETDIHFLRLNQADSKAVFQAQQENAVFIANPQNYLVLSYGEQQKPGDIYRDLQQLLSVSKEKGGDHAERQ